MVHSRICRGTSATLLGDGERRALGQNTGKNWKVRTFWICGDCQGQRIEDVKRKGIEHYVRMGRVWKRMVDLQFKDNIWDQSED